MLIVGKQARMNSMFTLSVSYQYHYSIVEGSIAQFFVGYFNNWPFGRAIRKMQRKENH